MKFRLDRSLALRTFGWHMVLAGGAVVLAFALFFFDGWVRVVAAGFAVFAVVSLWQAIRFIAFKPPVVMTLDERGFRASWRAGGRACRGTWASVHRVRLTQDGQYVVFELAGQESQAFWLPLVGGDDMALQAAISRYLNDANGYRPLS